MADTSKAQKLASAKKRFKELSNQKKNAQKTNNEATTPVDSMTSSTNSDLVIEPTVPTVPEPTALPNYFNNAAQPVFFDHFTINPNPQQQQQQEEPKHETTDNMVSYFDNLNTPNPENGSFFDQIPQNPYANPESVRQIEHAFEDYSLFPKNDHPNPEQDSETLEDPEIRDNNLYEGQRNNVITDQDTKDLLTYLQGPGTNEITDAIKEENRHIQSSNVESLRQLSDQMAELIDSNSDYAVSTSITDLEKRNLELAASLEQEKIKTQQLSASLKDSQTRNMELESKLQQKDSNQDFQTQSELVRLKDELQNRIQTMGMLVAENTELSASLSQFELTTKQKTLECEELQARLKTSRSLVADLEREINNLKMEKSRTDHFGKEQTDQNEKLRDEFVQLRELKDELEQDLQEAREKLKHSAQESDSLKLAIHDLTGKLSLADIKIQQLTSGDSHQTAGQLEQLTGDKFALEKQLATVNQMLKTITKERDESSQQYQQYAEQLNAQLYNLSTKIEQLQQEKENLVVQEQSRVKHIGDLERQLQSLQNDQVTYATVKTNGDYSAKNAENEALKEQLVQSQLGSKTLEENYTKVANEKEMLLKELSAKNESLSQLESMVEQLRGNQPDSVKLLATMESDKIAAARAVAQNKEMKQQMEGMNEVFLKLNNDKVELTEKLTVEQKSNKELFDKLQKTEITLQTLADAIEIKDRELILLRDSSERLNKQILQHEQLSDRLRHYEAQGHSSGALQNELQDAQATISKLNSELSGLKVADSCSHDHHDHTHHHHEHEHDHHEHDHKHEHAHEHEHKHSHEHDQTTELKQELLNLQQRNKQLEALLHKSDPNKDTNDNDEIDKEVAMKYLEDKFTRTMQEIAELQDEKQRLEHLVTQLQTETETIGEYVALYQHQRMVLKQRAVEKDQQLKQLASDREQMKEKLHKLNTLIHRIVSNKEDIGDLNNHHNHEHNYVIEEESVKKLVQEGDAGESKETAKEIMSLLSEIETSNLVQPNEEYHPCAMCHGQLITV